ncbi:MAG: M20/M25/M40 family metallo-hydrolase, partial [Candidatus Thorarchaeota archaeon SMTZ1-83]
TSNNLAIINTSNDAITIHLSPRGNRDDELEAFRRSLADLGRLGSWEVTMRPTYPGWAPDPNSPFLRFVKEHYERELGRRVAVEAIHAGLECGIVGAKIPGIQIVSIGPSLKNAHTPDEKLKIDDVGVLYDLLKSILEDIKSL